MAGKLSDQASLLKDIQQELLVRNDLEWVTLDEDLAIEKNRSFLQEASTFKRQGLNWLGLANAGGLAAILALISAPDNRPMALLVISPSLISFSLGAICSIFAVYAAYRETESLADIFSASLAFRRLSRKVLSLDMTLLRSSGFDNDIHELILSRHAEWRKMVAIQKSIVSYRSLQNLFSILALLALIIGVIYLAVVGTIDFSI